MLPNKAPTDVLLSRAEELLSARNLPLALECFDNAEATGSGRDRCAAGRWMVHMLHGDFAAAWKESDAIRARGAPDPHRVWNGEDIWERRVIVRCLHGLGDTVQLLRYAAQLNNRAAEVIWEVCPAMKHLAPYFHAVKRVVTWDDKCQERRDWDMQIEVTELPYVFRTLAAELPIATRYLALPSSMIRQAAREMGPRTVPRIGLVWGAGSWNVARSIPFALLCPLFETTGCEFWNLQGGALRGDCAGFALRDSGACSDGLLRLAGVMSQLDLVISVDTLAAHLAGSLGIPVWLMLQHAADWRWMEGRSDSPWYPSLRIFRQPAPGDWADVVCAVGNKLQQWLYAEDRKQSA